MSKLALALVMKDYDYLAPLVYGDVVAEGIDLKIHRDTENALDRTFSDPSIHAGELGLGRHLIKLAKGERPSVVGLPFFAYGGFRHRCFYVRRDNGLHELRDLAGKRIGVNDWLAEGHTWSRAALREQGVRIEQIKWLVGPIDNNPRVKRRPQGNVPSYVHIASSDRLLRDMLLEGELDALLCPFPPEGFFESHSPIVHLLRDFRRAEQEYYRRTGIVPITHIVGLRREVFERHPWAARSLYVALGESRARWQASRSVLVETTPWLVADIEEAIALFGPDWWPNGVEANRKAIQALCDEQFALGLVEQPLKVDAVFAEFEHATRRNGSSGEGVPL